LIRFSATIGPIIPPSIPMVLYALVSDRSVGYLFAAGMVPRLLMAMVLIIITFVPNFVLWLPRLLGYQG
jgi:C4-dicarboxylate transporter, DctM subunit